MKNGKPRRWTFHKIRSSSNLWDSGSRFILFNTCLSLHNYSLPAVIYSIKVIVRIQKKRRQDPWNFRKSLAAVNLSFSFRTPSITRRNPLSCVSILLCLASSLRTLCLQSNIEEVLSRVFLGQHLFHSLSHGSNLLSSSNSSLLEL